MVVMCLLGRKKQNLTMFTSRRSRSGPSCRLEMFLAQTTVEAGFPTLFLGADLVPWFWHFALFPQSVMFSAVPFGRQLAIAIARLAGSFFWHFFLSPKTVRCRMGGRRSIAVAVPIAPRI